jgi:hypothetical protein
MPSKRRFNENVLEQGYCVREDTPISRHFLKEFFSRKGRISLPSRSIAVLVRLFNRTHFLMASPERVHLVRRESSRMPHTSSVLHAPLEVGTSLAV